MQDEAGRLPAKATFLFPACVACCLVLLGWAVCAAYYRHPTPPFDPAQTAEVFYGPYQLNTYLLRFIPLVDNLGQKFAYQAMLVALLAILVGAPLLRSSKMASWSGVGLALGTAVVLGCAGWFCYLCLRRRLGWTPYASGLGLVAFLYLLGPLLLRRRWNLGPGLVVAVLLIVLLAPAAFLRLDQSSRSWSNVEVLEAHYALVMSHGDRLAAGFKLFDDVTPAYGVLTPLFTALVQRCFGSLSLHGYTMFIEGLQAVYLGLMTYCYYVYCRRRWIVCVFAVFFVAMHYHFHNPFQATGTPNHTALRAIAFPLGCWALMLLQNASLRKAAFALGVVGALALCQCWDMGIAIMAGLVTYLVLRFAALDTEGKGRRLAVLGVCFGAGFLVAGLAVVLGMVAVDGSLPHLRSLKDFFYVMRVGMVSSYSGTRGSFEPLAILMFAHAVFALVQVWLQPSAQRHFFGCFRGAVAATLLIWFSYYAQRPDGSYLLSFFILYGFLLTDVCRVLILARRWRVGRWSLLAATSALAVVIVPYVFMIIPGQWYWYRKGLETVARPPDEKSAALLSGVYFPRDRRTLDLVQKTSFLHERSKDGPVIYFTADSYLVPKLSGVWSAIPTVDVFWETTMRRQYARLLHRVITSGAEEIYFDSDESLAPDPARPDPSPPRPGQREFYRQLRTDLASHFDKDKVVCGWEVWRRRGPMTNEERMANAQ